MPARTQDQVAAVTDQVLVVGARQAIAGREAGAREPLLRLRGTCLGGSFILTRGELRPGRGRPGPCSSLG